MNAYFLFDTHPLMSNGYKLIANISNNKITPYSIIIDLFLKGCSVHTINLIVSARHGATKKGILFLRFGLMNSFINNLIASLIGCKIPLHEGLLGPFRACVIPRIFRSNKVKNATLINTGNQIIINSVKIIFSHFCNFNAALLRVFLGLFCFVIAKLRKIGLNA